MFSGRGVPLGDRPVAAPKPEQPPRSAVRHCWVTGPAQDPGPWPGLVLEWRRDSSGWRALVVYAITAETDTTTVQTWVPAGHLKPS